MGWLLHLLQFYWAPTGRPWWTGSAWESVLTMGPAAAVTITAGWLWSRTSYWPLVPIKRLIEHTHAKLDEHTEHFRRVARNIETVHEKVRRLRDHAEAHGDAHRAHAEKLDRIETELAALRLEVGTLHARHGRAFEQLVKLLVCGVYHQPLPEHYSAATAGELRRRFDEAVRQILAGEQPPILDGLNTNDKGDPHAT